MLKGADKIMNVFLMHKNKDFNLNQKLPFNDDDLIRDLELNTLFKAMSAKDEFLFDVAKKAVLSGLNDIDAILYRQSILKDCLNNPNVIREIYKIAEEAVESMKKSYFSVFTNYPTSILHNSMEMLHIFINKFIKLKKIIHANYGRFKSDGFINLFGVINNEFDNEYIDKMKNLLKQLKFPNGYLLSAELGVGNKSVNYKLCKFEDKGYNLFKRILDKKSYVYTIVIDNNDDNEARILSTIKEKGINYAANSLAQSADYIADFFNLLRTEIAFYVCCLNLYDELSGINQNICFPEPVSINEHSHSFKGLYDAALALTMKKNVVDNNLNLDNKDLIIIFGANQGGKSTFLKSAGLAQLMMQCGMFTAADSYVSSVYDNIFTHFRREEDVEMNSGKLDEELSRLSLIIDNITHESMLLLNESFASTNEREGSEIAKQIIKALSEKRIKVLFVTHLYEFTSNFFNNKSENVIFLQAQRKADGSRSFKLAESEPIETSYGEDLYKEIFK